MNAKQCYTLIAGVLLLSLSSVNELKAQTQDPLIPNVFSPNNDGRNDVFQVSNLEGSWEMHIYDRWGNLVFATQQAQGAAWDGRNIQGEEADTGVYFYVLKDMNSAQNYSGSLHLFR